MSRIAYVNGRYVPHRDAMVHIEDRGYQFSDGVYEVIGVASGRVIDEEPHWDRLDRSLGELNMAWPMSRAALRLIVREVLRQNGVRDGMVYIQVTRGVAPRDHAFPKNAPAALVVTARRSRPASREAQNKGVTVITIPDIRWKRCDIKTVGLLPNVLGKQRAHESGAFEAWMVNDEGFVTEGTSTNAWIVTKDGELVTRQTDTTILPGITRASLVALVRDEGLRLVERPFTPEEAKAAKEAFITSTTSYVMPVVKIDGHAIGDGTPGPVTRRLQDWYRNYAAGPGAAA
ncbi:MAG TPA: D-amino-acid transaminase [Alphaproteobacteria bacterium]|nr:D-amino-acid transaminase [Alphaproteobacteria bacterium]